MQRHSKYMHEKPCACWCLMLLTSCWGPQNKRTILSGFCVNGLKFALQSSHGPPRFNTKSVGLRDDIGWKGWLDPTYPSLWSWTAKQHQTARLTSPIEELKRPVTSKTTWWLGGSCTFLTTGPPPIFRETIYINGFHFVGKSYNINYVHDNG